LQEQTKKAKDMKVKVKGLEEERRNEVASNNRERELIEANEEARVSYES
jgi:hypothetical protein